MKTKDLPNSVVQKYAHQLTPNKGMPNAIYQVDLRTGKITAEYYNPKEAANATSTSLNNIRQCIDNSRSSAGGYGWITKEQFLDNQNYLPEKVKNVLRFIREEKLSSHEFKVLKETL